MNPYAFNSHGLKTNHLLAFIFVIWLLVFGLSTYTPNTHASGDHEHHQDKKHQAHGEEGHDDRLEESHEKNHQSSTVISERQANLAGIKTAVAGPSTLRFNDTLFGVIAVPADGLFHINAPYPGLVETVHVQVGKAVKKGQRLVTLTNTDTLQRYSINSPTDGEITERFVNQGDRAEGRPLLQVVNLSRVWVEMSAFPESIEKLAVGQPVTVRDLHQHQAAVGNISYVASQMTGGHIARTRAVIDNSDGHWRPGMHIKAEVEIDRRQIPVAIKTSAVQNFLDKPVVFTRSGDTFEARTVELGERSDDMVEVLGGLQPGTEYVTENSFLIKADILKSGASHDH